MQQLDSKEYIYVNVTLRDETLIMPTANGLRLMEYLTGDNVSSHVMITTKDGQQVVVNKSDIRKVSPVSTKTSSYKTASELGMGEASPDTDGDGYQKFKQMRQKLIDKS